MRRGLGPVIVRRAAAATGAALLLLLLGPAWPAPAGSPVLAHAQLVSSAPGSGEVVDESPAEIRLIFSEPVDAAHTSLSLLDGEGRGIAFGLGRPDPNDPYALVAEIEPLGEGTYLVQWRALSAADGHATLGFVTFGVGDVTLDGSHSGHEGMGAHRDPTASEILSRLAGYLGFMLALGFAAFGALALRPITGRWPRRLGLAQAGALALGALGAGWLGLAAADAANIDPAAYLGGTRTGNLLIARVVLGLAGATGVLLLLRARRPGAAFALGATAAVAALVLFALGGHAAAYASPAPVAATVVHLGAASVWLAGVVALAAIAVGRRRARRLRALVRIVPRFSALALVAVALVGLTGTYLAWVQTRDLTSLAGDYPTMLGLKVALFVAALSLGALNYLEGGREPRRRAGFQGRIALEAGLALGVLVATGNLASGSPPAQERPIPIAAATTIAPQAIEATLEVQPGRPGPNRFWVSLPAAPPEGSQVEVALQRLDQAGDLRFRLHDTDDPVLFVADGGLLQATSRWDAAVVVRDAAGLETGRARFAFGLDDTSISEGRAVPPLDPAVAVAVLLIVGALLGGAYVLAGGSLPRTDQRVARLAMLGGGATAGALGLVLLVAGPRL